MRRHPDLSFGCRDEGSRVVVDERQATDLGFRVVIVQDALCSSSDTGHDALMTMYRTRFNAQIDLISAAELFDIWRPD